MRTRRTWASYSGMVALALLAVSCTESVAPERTRVAPSFSYSPNGVTPNRSSSAMGQSGSLIVKAGQPGSNTD